MQQLAVKSIFTDSNYRCLSWIIRKMWEIIGSYLRDHFNENWGSRIEEFQEVGERTMKQALNCCGFIIYGALTMYLQDYFK